MTVSADEILAICHAVGAYQSKPDGSEMLGLYMEGPFISEEKCGAQNSDHIQQVSESFFRRAQEAANGRIRIISLAPEKEGALAFIKAHRKEVICSLGHSSADYDTARQAISAGAANITHLFNGMPTFGHRAPGIVGAALDSACMAEMICDGNYVGETMMRATYKMFGDDRIIMISDCIRAAGIGEGAYDFGGLTYHVKGTVARMENGALVGPVASLRESLKKTVLEFGVPLESAVKSATINPARLLGESQYGAIRPGNFADIVLLDKELNVRLVMKKGRIKECQTS
jgi:N-acetylglucosamine-6-phosphate deacetylase